MAGIPTRLCSDCGHPLHMHKSGDKCCWRGCLCKSAITSLTNREYDVLELLAKGKTVKECATALEVGTATIESHIYNIIMKTKAHGIKQLVFGAVHDGLIDIKTLPGLPVRVGLPRDSLVLHKFTA